MNQCNMILAVGERADGGRRIGQPSVGPEKVTSAGNSVITEWLCAGKGMGVGDG